MKTIAIIESCDTKYIEAGYMKECVEKAGFHALVLNTSTGPVECANPDDNGKVVDISREEIVAAYGMPWEEVKNKTKGEKIEIMRKAITAYVDGLYLAGKIHGIISVGGLQNTVMATAAMSVLPVGFPKVMATTVACGTKQFSLVVGDKDIVAMPMICDCTGLNLITRRVIANACGCVTGMAQMDGKPIAKGDKPVIGLTLMGVTNNGAMAAVEELERNGYEVLGFHATGVGGSVMEQMAADGLIDGVLDLTTHEITSEYFGGGFSYGPGAATRLLKTTANRVPLVVSLGGIDFVDYAKKEAHVVPNLDQRKTYDHNADTVHIKISKEEAADIAKILAQRLNTADYPVKLLIPTDGMRHNTTEGEALWDPEADRVMIETLKASLKDQIEVVELEGNLDTREWGLKAAEIMLDVMKGRR